MSATAASADMWARFQIYHPAVYYLTGLGLSANTGLGSQKMMESGAENIQNCDGMLTIKITRDHYISVYLLNSTSHHLAWNETKKEFLWVSVRRPRQGQKIIPRTNTLLRIKTAGMSGCWARHLSTSKSSLSHIHLSATSTMTTTGKGHS